MTSPTTAIAINWLDRARTAEARVRELEARVLELHRAEMAAWAAALEEAAKVADGIADEWPDAPEGRHDDWRHGRQDGSMEVAAAIRELGAVSDG